jgi:hypothetical protein
MYIGLGIVLLMGAVAILLSPNFRDHYRRRDTVVADQPVVRRRVL